MFESKVLIHEAVERTLEAFLAGRTPAEIAHLSPEGRKSLAIFGTLLLRWNARMNLIGPCAPEELVEKHFLDAFIAACELGKCPSLLDLGAGAGLPGLPLAALRPELQATLVDSVEKKVAFMKNAVLQMGLTQRVSVRRVRLNGTPEIEQIERAFAVSSRAFREPSEYLLLARRYVLPGGLVLAFLGRVPEDRVLFAWGEKAELRFRHVRPYVLPSSGAERGLAVYQA